MKLPDTLRDQLKIPLGKLILEDDTTKENILKHIPQGSFLITVGDATTEKMLKFGLIPSLQIVDGKEKRLKRNPPVTSKKITTISCTNPAGEITPESIAMIKQAFESTTPTRMLIIGEEDLLVIPVCIYAPKNSVVMYGQPNEGLVIVQINPEIRNKTKKLLELME